MNSAVAAPHVVLTLRRNIHAMVRRRVPHGEVEDVSQTILCEAIDALSRPREGGAIGTTAEPEELRRFVAGIARNEVADYHRRARVRGGELSAIDHDDEAAAAASPPPPVEARALLGRIAESVTTPRERETLGWLVREHEGEQLREIAAESGLPAPAVRQRVSRLRRALRARFLQAIALLLVAGSCGALARRGTRDAASIRAEPQPLDTAQATARALRPLDGRWRLDRVVDDPGRKKLALTPSIDLRISGARVFVRTPAGTTTRDVARVEARPDGAFDLDLASGGSGARVEHATVRVDGDALLVTVHDGPVRGAATFTRRTE